MHNYDCLSRHAPWCHPTPAQARPVETPPGATPSVPLTQERTPPSQPNVTDTAHPLRLPRCSATAVLAHARTAASSAALRATLNAAIARRGDFMAEFLDRTREHLLLTTDALRTILANPQEYVEYYVNGRYHLTDAGRALFDIGTPGELFGLNLADLTKSERAAILKLLNSTGLGEFEIGTGALGEYLLKPVGDASVHNFIYFVFDGRAMGLDELEQALLNLEKIIAAIDRAVPRPPVSSWALHDQLLAAIDAMEEGYLDRYQTVVMRYTAFFDDVNQAIAQLPKSLRVDSGGEITIESEFLELVKQVREKWGRDDVLLTGLTPDEALAWADLLGPLSVASGGSVKINLEPLDDLISLIAANELKWLAPAKFAAFQSALEVHTSKLETNMQTLVQKFGTANATFDNLIKVLSSTIASLLEADKNFLNV